MSGFVTVAGRTTLSLDPEDQLDFIIDLSPWLHAGDYLTSATYDNTSTVEVQSCTINSAPLDIEDYGQIAVSSAVILWVTGGQVGTVGRITLHLITSGADGGGVRKRDVTVTVIVKHR